jgi:hypothetical protein
MKVDYPELRIYDRKSTSLYEESGAFVTLLNRAATVLNGLV